MWVGSHHLRGNDYHYGRAIERWRVIYFKSSTPTQYHYNFRDLPFYLYVIVLHYHIFNITSVKVEGVKGSNKVLGPKEKNSYFLCRK